MKRGSEALFAVTSPGLEEICLAELRPLGIDDAEIVPGGVEFAGGLRELYLTNLWLRTASRILVRLDTFKARDFPGLYRNLVKLPWGRYIRPGTPLEVRVSSRKSRLNHTGRIAETVDKAVTKALGQECHPGVKTFQRVQIRFQDDQCQVSIDSSGELLHKRGYRQHGGDAPLRETLAAAILMRLGWHGQCPLVDAMTGSGTFVIEAALLAANRAPGGSRDFSFMAWPGYRGGLWKQLLHEAEKQSRSEPGQSILGNDLSPQVIEFARDNAVRAGVAEKINFSSLPMQELKASGPEGLILCNPPYGERLGRTQELHSLFRDLGRLYATEFGNWQSALLCTGPEMEGATGLELENVLRFSNGGLKVDLLEKTGPGRHGEGSGGDKS